MASGKQKQSRGSEHKHLAFERLENRNLLSADSLPGAIEIISIEPVDIDLNFCPADFGIGSHAMTPHQQPDDVVLSEPVDEPVEVTGGIEFKPVDDDQAEPDNVSKTVEPDVAMPSGHTTAIEPDVDALNEPDKSQTDEEQGIHVVETDTRQADSSTSKPGDEDNPVYRSPAVVVSWAGDSASRLPIEDVVVFEEREEHLSDLQIDDDGIADFVDGKLTRDLTVEFGIATTHGKSVVADVGLQDIYLDSDTNPPTGLVVGNFESTSLLTDLAFDHRQVRQPTLGFEMPVDELAMDLGQWHTEFWMSDQIVREIRR